MDLKCSSKRLTRHILNCGRKFAEHNLDTISQERKVVAPFGLAVPIDQPSSFQQSQRNIQSTKHSLSHLTD